MLSNEDRICEEVGVKAEHIRNKPAGVGKLFGIRKCIFAERSIAAARGEVSGRT